MAQMLSATGFYLVLKFAFRHCIHIDHMGSFETSKGAATIIASEPTLKLLIAEFDADLPYRANVEALGQGQSHRKPVIRELL